MAELEIRIFGDPVLRQRAREVERLTDVHRRLVDDMIETMRAAPGVGLAGPQIGVVERVFVYEVEEDVGAIVNPKISFRSPETEVDDEGCLSLPGLLYPVERHVSVLVEGVDPVGGPVIKAAEGLLARVFQHEIDHLDGVLFVDRLPPELRRKAMRELTQASLGLAPSTTPVRGESL
ncbi:MAG: peptide deformylase [Actinomycetota bacterium]|nr:peptide deformylase [Actinomycetota bacterium]